MACLVERQSSYVSIHSGLDCDDVFPTDDGFFDMITRFQGYRLDDQRTALPPALASNSSGVGKKKEEDLLEVLWQVQGSRIEEQRCHMMSAPHVMPAASHWEETEAECLTADELFELIFTCQDSRINDQRSQVPAVPLCHKSTMPSEDFFNLIQHLQSTRIEDQRSPLPILAS